MDKDLVHDAWIGSIDVDALEFQNQQQSESEWLSLKDKKGMCVGEIECEMSWVCNKKKIKQVRATGQGLYRKKKDLSGFCTAYLTGLV